MNHILLMLAGVLAAAHAFAGDGARQIDRAIDSETLIAARVDGTKLDVNATAELLTEALRAAGVSELDAAIALGAQMIDARVKEFLSLGGRDAFAVFSLADLPRNDTPSSATILPGPRVVIPLYEGADAKGLTDLLTSAGVPVTQPPAADALWGGDVERLAQLLQSPPATARPEFAAAFQAVNNAPIQVVIAPPDYARRVVEDFAPMLVDPFDDVPISVITDGARWVAVGVALPPKPSIRMVIQSKDAEAAANLRELTVDAIAFARTQLAELKPGVRLPDQRLIAVLSDALQRLRPEARGDQVIIELDSAALRELLRVAAPAFVGARKNAEKAYVMSQFKAIGSAVYAYASDHKDLTPESLDVLVEEQSITEDMIRANGVDRVEYLAPSINTRKIKDAYKVIMLYERYDAWPPRGVIATYADGHVEAVTDETQLKDLIERSRAEFARVKESNE